VPHPSRRERAWAIVADAADVPNALRDDLEARAYDTGTRGRRVRADARRLSEGGYAIARHDAHSHLVYAPARGPPEAEGCSTCGPRPATSSPCATRALRRPAEPGCRVPAAPSSRRTSAGGFGDRRRLAVDDPALRNHEGVELVLIGADEHVAGDLGMELDAAGGHARHRAVAG
jgi:hypothetical protein